MLWIFWIECDEAYIECNSKEQAQQWGSDSESKHFIASYIFTINLFVKIWVNGNEWSPLHGWRDIYTETPTLSFNWKCGGSLFAVSTTNTTILIANFGCEDVASCTGYSLVQLFLCGFDAISIDLNENYT